MTRNSLVAGKVLFLLVVGLVLAVIPVFDVIFTDKHSRSDYAVGLVLVGAAFLIVGGTAAVLTRSWRLPFWLTPPPILVLVAYSRTEPQQIPYHAAVLAALLAGTATGAVVAARLRARAHSPIPLV